MRHAITLVLVLAAASAEAGPSSTRPRHHATKAPAAPASATIVVGTEAPQPKVLIVHPRDARAVVGRPSMDDHLNSLPHHLH